jgi:ubiquinone/menaquinone biosynthesis C-methylase UbiE
MVEKLNIPKDAKCMDFACGTGLIASELFK